MLVSSLHREKIDVYVFRLLLDCFSYPFHDNATHYQ